MAKSRIIKELVNEEISLSVALKRLIVLANDLNDFELKQWAEKEFNGYLIEDELPKYRILKSLDFIYTGINGPLQIIDQPLNTGFISPENLKVFETNKILEPISTIEEKSKNIKGQMYIDRTSLAGDVYANSSNGLNGIQCTSIKQIFTSVHFKKIIETVSAKVLNILLKLDAEFGNLDNLDIGLEKNKKKVDSIKRNINMIIFGEDAHIKNSTLIPGVLNSDTNKTKIIKSNIGKGSNSITTETQIQTQVDITKEEKKCWLKKIFHKRSK